MAAELDAGRSEVARFLALRPPFDGLAPDELDGLVGHTQIEFHLAGAAILTEGGGPVTFLRVIHSGAVELVHAGKLLDLLGPGDTFGQAAMLSGLPPGFEARAAEDTLCYRIPVSVGRPLLERARNRELNIGLHEPRDQAVARLIRSETVVCEPTTSIREIARRMTEAGASAAIVELGDGRFGIVTDRDIRTGVVAGETPPSGPVTSVMTTPVFAVTPDRLGGDVLFELLERGIRHAVVVDERGHLVGVVEEADVFAVHLRSWFGVRRSVDRARGIDALAAAASHLSEIAVDLHASNLRALEVARVVSALVDAITVRALELSAEGAGLPEDGLLWVALGSQARREMTPASLARGALICSELPPTAWLERLRSALRSCGLPDQVVARSPQQWLASDPNDELALTVLVERRALWGTPRDPLPAASGAAQARVLSALAARALEATPPTGFDADAVLEPGGQRRHRLDIRRSAVIPIVELGRWVGAAAGLTEGSTLERLHAAAEAGVVTEADASSLSDAFELACELRIAHHMEQLTAGAPPDDQLEPGAMSPLARDHLRDVFRAVAGVQRKLRP